MDLFKIRAELMAGKSIYDLPLKVTYYARVSTDKDEQLNSLGNQIFYYEDLKYLDEQKLIGKIKKKKLKLEEDKKSSNFFFKLFMIGTKNILRIVYYFLLTILVSVGATALVNQNIREIIIKVLKGGFNL